MPTPADRAFRDLVGAGLVNDPGPLEDDEEPGARAFSCMLPVPYPNGERLPSAVRFRVRIPARFPYSKVEFLPLDSAVRGFAHQDGKTGALCLKPTEYPHQPSERLRTYVESAKDWLVDAAKGTLLEAGQHWELPDFGTRNPPGTVAEVLTLEDASTFGTWASRVGQIGEVCFAAHARPQCGLVAARFTQRGTTVLAPTVSESFLDRAVNVIGAWLLLPSLIVERHRPAWVFSELEAQCNAAHIDLWHVIHRVSKQGAHQGHHYILVGAPIPTVVEGPDAQVHWQPFVLPEEPEGPEKAGKSGHWYRRSEPKHVRATLSPRPVPWSPVTNYPPERSEARGSLSEALKRSRLCVLGCGAVGSILADHLVRGGVRTLALFDRETLDLENLSRHTLSPADVGENKAVAEARRLKGIHPAVSVDGFPVTLPLLAPARKTDREPGTAWDHVQRADVLIDCTASDVVFDWVSTFGRERGRMVLHVFINANATMLTLCCSGKHASCRRVTGCLLGEIADGRTGIGTEEYDPPVGERFPGTGCWHPTFPALGSHVALLVAAAVPVIETLVSQGRSSAGTAIVFRRREMDVQQSASFPLSTVEVAWSARYR